MKGKNRALFFTGVGLLGIFVLWTVLVRFVDVQAIGPQESSVGFAALNGYVHNLTGVNSFLYELTDWLGLVPICIALYFAFLGLAQWIRRKSLRKVDYSILVLGGFYIAVAAVFFLFEVVVINYRPTLIEGVLEVSYPSSTTMLVACIMPTATLQFRGRINNKTLKNCVLWVNTGFTAFMVIGRLLSGVHWLTDIIGGILVSAGLVLIYYAVSHLKDDFTK